MINILVSVVFCFLLLIFLMFFFTRHKSRLPYHKMTQSQCVNLMKKAVNGVLPEHEWHTFIGISILDNEQLDSLREQCVLIDENEVKGTHLVNGRPCVTFSKKGISELEKLLDEWQHKSDFLI